MSITIIAPPVPSSKWKSAFSTLAPDIPVFEGYKLNKPEQIKYATLWRDALKLKVDFHKVTAGYVQLAADLQQGKTSLPTYTCFGCCCCVCTLGLQLVAMHCF
mgnify:CR=1 FL=1